MHSAQNTPLLYILVDISINLTTVFWGLHFCHVWTIAKKTVPQIFYALCNKNFGFMYIRYP